ncbi:hypothetical protein [Exiguobacterium oxidotolerans]|uniref:Uncharacterized protein n=1 Tax=Exiguobacterium oxidotolerans TaxID=223958 RepID=A0A653IEU5_9BACL|nr:hypothetical protein [Exiguobacterium oxidotolerans]VWX37665.1 conserved membrane hypothetical protein [Exiguobacterium oxidotolerans]
MEKQTKILIMQQEKKRNFLKRLVLVVVVALCLYGLVQTGADEWIVPLLVILVFIHGLLLFGKARRISALSSIKAARRLIRLRYTVEFCLVPILLPIALLARFPDYLSTPVSIVLLLALLLIAFLKQYLELRIMRTDPSHPTDDDLRKKTRMAN